jgi:hypothetical protein
VLVVGCGAAVLALIGLSEAAWNSRGWRIWGTGIRSLRAWPMQAIPLLVQLPCWMAPAMVIFRLSREKREGSLDALVLTPLAPLRVCAAKLWGRLAPLCLVALLVAVVNLYWPCSYRHPVWVYGMPPMSWAVREWYWIYRPLGLALPAFVVPQVLAAGALGAYFAIRLRTAAGAAVASYLALLVLSFVWLFAWTMLQRSFLSPLHGHGREFWTAGAGSLASVVGMGLVLRICLTESARRLALGRD